MLVQRLIYPEDPKQMKQLIVHLSREDILKLLCGKTLYVEQKQQNEAMLVKMSDKEI